MIRPFLKREFFERIHLHPVGASLEDIFENDVPRSHMPKEFGGELGTIKELHEKTKKTVEDMREYFLTEDDQSSLKLDEFVHSIEYKYHSRYA